MKVYAVRYYSPYECDYFEEGLFSDKTKALTYLAEVTGLDYKDVVNADNNFNSLNDDYGYYIQELEVL